MKYKCIECKITYSAWKEVEGGYMCYRCSMGNNYVPTPNKIPPWLPAPWWDDKVMKRWIEQEKNLFADVKRGT